MTLLDDLKKFTDKRPIIKNPRISLMLNIIFAVLAIANFIYPSSSYSLYDFILGLIVLLLVYIEKPASPFKKSKSNTEGHTR